MARKRNVRNLRSSLWSNPMFCLYCAKNGSVYNWTNALRVTHKLYDMSHKLCLKTKKKKKKNSM